MKMIVLIALATLTGALAQAADRNAAAAICSGMSFDSTRSACVSSIGKYNYFDQAAISACDGMSFDSTKLSCVDAIGNKVYERYETDNCNSLSFDSSKLSCLQNGGRKALPPPPPPITSPGCYSKSQIIFELERIDRMVYDRDNARASNALYDLMYTLKRCL